MVDWQKVPTFNEAVPTPGSSLSPPHPTPTPTPKPWESGGVQILLNVGNDLRTFRPPFLGLLSFQNWPTPRSSLPQPHPTQTPTPKPWESGEVHILLNVGNDLRTFRPPFLGLLSFQNWPIPRSSLPQPHPTQTPTPKPWESGGVQILLNVGNDLRTFRPPFIGIHIFQN